VTSKHNFNAYTLRLGAGLAIAIGVTACDRAQLHQDVQDSKQAVDKLANKTERALDNASREATQVRANLPSSDQVRNRIEGAGQDVVDAVQTTAKKVEDKALEARQNVRDRLAKSK
jgi:hypothetical protein